MRFLKYIIRFSTLFVTMCVVLALSSNTVMANVPYDTDFEERVDVLSVLGEQLAKKNPNGKQIFKKIKEGLPKDVKSKLESLLKPHKVKSEDELWDIITEKNLLFFRSKSGAIFTIRTSRVEEAINDLLNHIASMDPSKFSEIYKLAGGNNILPDYLVDMAKNIGVQLDSSQNLQRAIPHLKGYATQSLIEKIKKRSVKTNEKIKDQLANGNLRIADLDKTEVRDDSKKKPPIITPTYDTTRLDAAFKAMEG